MVVEADTFFGTTASSTVGDFIEDGYAQINKTKIQLAGLRQYTDADDGFVPE